MDCRWDLLFHRRYLPSLAPPDHCRSQEIAPLGLGRCPEAVPVLDRGGVFVAGPYPLHLDNARWRRDYSIPWKEIKRLFTKGYLEQVGPGEMRNDSRMSRGEAAIWQRRFWEHTIRDEEDLNRHRDYIHYNPVKHGLVKSVSDWPWSSFHRYMKMGYYEAGWGDAPEESLKRMECGE